MYEDDVEVLKRLYSELVGDVAKVAKQVGIKRQQILFDPEIRLNRLKRAITLATVEGELRADGSALTSVRELMKAIASGEREPKLMRNGEEHEETRLDEFYDTVTPVDATALQTSVDWNLKDISAAQQADDFSKTMKHYLTKGEIPEQLSSQLVDDESDYESDDDECQAPARRGVSAEARRARRTAALVMELAPHFTVSEGGLLLRLHQKKGHKNQGLAQELQLRQQIHIPSQAKDLQKSIALTVHREAAHPGF